jgi:hypothetical protein
VSDRFACSPRAHGRAQRLRDDARIGHRTEIAEPHPVTEVVGDPSGDLFGHARLPAPAGTGQRDQTVLHRQRVDVLELLRPSDEARETDGQIAGARGRRTQRREFAHEIRNA